MIGPDIAGLPALALAILLIAASALGALCWLVRVARKIPDDWRL